jgi:hypothetical protein
MFLMVILKVAALQKEGQLNYINALTIKKDLIREYGRVPRCKRVEDVKRGRKFHRLNVIGGLLVV